MKVFLGSDGKGTKCSFYYYFTIQLCNQLHIHSTDLNISKILFTCYVILDDKISINKCSRAVWTLPLLFYSGRETDARLGV